MNKISIAYLLLIITPLLSAHRIPVRKQHKNNASKSFIVSTPDANERYSIDTKESELTWKCSMAFAGKGGHNGFVTISKGQLIFEKSLLVGGAVEIDMNTIADEHHRSDNNLIEHLQSPDFFDVKEFPTATFVITLVAPRNSENINVTGNLTIKGITHAVTFPASIEVKGTTISANGKLTIDRTKWDVRYNSGKFFDNLADEAISDSIEFEMKIVAKK
jgi:polyisoprenoid-binding protein YceI